MADVRFSTVGIEAWVRTFDDLENTCARQGEEMWGGVSGPMEYMFGRSQEAVHVLTGNLKLSGHTSTEREGDRIVGTIAYDIDYAIYEAGRGGEHDYITRAYVASERVFEATMTDIWDHVTGAM